MEISMNQENQIDRLVRGGKLSSPNVREAPPLPKALANEDNSGK